MSAPRVNQTVWFWKDGEGRGKVPEPAIVTEVYGETSVDLWVFCGHGAQREEKLVVICGDGAVASPLGRYATFRAAGRKPEEAKVGA